MIKLEGFFLFGQKGFLTKVFTTTLLLLQQQQKKTETNRLSLTNTNQRKRLNRVSKGIQLNKYQQYLSTIVLNYL